MWNILQRWMYIKMYEYTMKEWYKEKKMKGKRTKEIKESKKEVKRSKQKRK